MVAGIESGTDSVSKIKVSLNYIPHDKLRNVITNKVISHDTFAHFRRSLKILRHNTFVLIIIFYHFKIEIMMQCGKYLSTKYISSKILNSGFQLRI